MRKIIMLFSTLMLIFGALFILSSVALASEIEILQPASSITYNEDLTVNGTGRFNSVQIGSEGVGGVTYFNGSIVNIGESIPVTFGDDVRIDGEIWRGTSKGIGDGMPLKISDTMIPTLDDINDLGWPNKRWQNIYFSQNLIGNNVSLQGELALQSFRNNPDTNIKVSVADPIRLGVFAGLNQNFKGYYHSSNTQNKEIALGEFRVKDFIEQGTDVEFLGLTGYDRSKKHALLLGFGGDKNQPGSEGAMILYGGLDGSTEAAKLGIQSSEINIEAGNKFNVRSGEITLEQINNVVFKNQGTLVTSGSDCYIGTEKVEDGTMMRGNDGTGLGLYYCEGGWNKL